MPERDGRRLWTRGQALTGLGLSFDVFNGGTATAGNPGPTFAQLQNYRAVVFFTGNNTVSWANGFSILLMRPRPRA